MADQMKEIDAAKTPTEELVKEVTELVEDGFHLTMGKEGGLVSDRLGKVSCNQAEMRFAGRPIFFGEAGLQIVHPGPASFRLPRMPVGIE